MKVVGTGSPEALTLHLQACERETLLEELFRTRAGLITELAGEQARAGSHGGGDDRVESHHLHLAVLAQIVRQLEDWEPEDGDIVEVRGPNWVLCPVIRQCAQDAQEQLAAALGRFRDPEDSFGADQLRRVADAAHAWVETLIDYEHVDNHGFDAEYELDGALLASAEPRPLSEQAREQPAQAVS